MLNGAIAHTNSILPALNEVKYFYFLIKRWVWKSSICLLLLKFAIKQGMWDMCHVLHTNNSRRLFCLVWRLTEESCHGFVITIAQYKGNCTRRHI